MLDSWNASPLRSLFRDAKGHDLHTHRNTRCALSDGSAAALCVLGQNWSGANARLKSRLQHVSSTCSPARVCVCILFACVLCNSGDPQSVPVRNLLLEHLIVWLYSLRWDWFLLWLQAACSEDGGLPPVHCPVQVSSTCENITLIKLSV